MENRRRPIAYSVFISSTFLDLSLERRAIKEALNELNMLLAPIGVCFLPVDLQEGADSEPPLDVCLSRLADCDLVITLIGHRAGWLAPDGRSITECEFDCATVQGLPCLAYVRDANTLILPEYVDTGDAQITALKRFRGKVDGRLKRDIFRSPEHLRGHIFRDLLNWLFKQPGVEAAMTDPAAPNALPEVRDYLRAINSGEAKRAVEIVTSRRFVLDMRRFDAQPIHMELLCDLLELGSLSPPTHVIEVSLRSRLLLQLLSEFPESAFCSGCPHRGEEPRKPNKKRGLFVLHCSRRGRFSSAMR